MTIKINDVRIDQVQNTKFLGVIINSNLKWNDHVKCITNKEIKNIGILQRLRYRVPIEILKTLYFTQILPYLKYCNIVWGSITSVYLDKLFLKQKKAICIIGGAKWNDHSMLIFVHLGLFTLSNIDKFQIYCFMFKIQHKLMPLIFQKLV